MVTEMVLASNGAIRFRDTESKKWVNRPEGLTINKESLRKNIGTLEASGRMASSARKSIFGKDYKPEDIRQFFETDELVFASVERLRRDLFAKGAEITAYMENGDVHKGATDFAQRFMQKH